MWFHPAKNSAACIVLYHLILARRWPTPPFFFDRREIDSNTTPGYRPRHLQEPANGACGGHPRVVPYSKMSSKGHTELQISLSGAENVKEAAGDIRFCFAPQKTSEISEKRIFRTIFQNLSGNFRNRSNASERFRTHPNTSELIRTDPNRSEWHTVY